MPRLKAAALAVVVAVAAALVCSAAASDPLARSTEKRIEAERQQRAGADMLKDLEWSPGSRDPSLAEDRKAWVFEPYDRTVRQPTHVFGVQYPEKASAVKGGGLRDQYDSEADLDAAKLGAALVDAYSSKKGPSPEGTAPLLREYERALKTNTAFARRLKDHFAELDLNHDRAVDVTEINHAVNQGKLSYIGARVLKSWDINFSRKLSWEEFRLGPIFVVVLESHPKILQGFRLNVPGIESTVARLYRAALGTYYMTNPAATGLLEVGSQTGRLEKAGLGAQVEAQAEAQARAQAEAQAQAQVAAQALATAQARAQAQAGAKVQAGAKAQAGAQVEALSESEVQRRVLEHLGLKGQARAETAAEAQARRDQGIKDLLGKAAGAIGGFVSNDAGYKKKDTAANEDENRPKATWGIPKTIDQECVLCQYVVQRIQAQLKSLAMDDATSFGAASSVYPKSAFPSGGFPGSDAVQGIRGGFPSVEGMPDSRRDSVGPRARLVSERGSRSPTRMIENLATKVIRAVCGETAPYLFRDMCSDIFKKRQQLSYGLFRRLSAGGACMMADFCGKKSYFFTKVGVHYPSMSSKLNGGVGLCGMIGGPKARAYEGATENKCFMQKLGKKAGILRFQEQQQQQEQENNAVEEALEARTAEENENDPLRLNVLTQRMDEPGAGRAHRGPPQRPAAAAGMELNEA